MISTESITKVRHHLHKNPEIAGEERNTSDFIRDFFEQNFPGFDIISGIAGHGLIVSKKYGEGNEFALRAELDALPVFEENSIEHRSTIEGKSHACGHDGHMSILLETVRQVEAFKPKKGRLTLLFQPAEETGEGAKAMLEANELANFRPSIMYALHNIPGKPLGTVLSKDGSFACGSVGIRIAIKGKTAHAAHPEMAINPLVIATEILHGICALPEKTGDFSLVTPIALRSGERTFGTSPRKAVLLLTLRARKSSDLKYLMNECEKLIESKAGASNARCSFTFEEYFPVTENHTFTETIKKACQNTNTPFELMVEPNRWSEDFGHYGEKFPTYMFGLGSGEKMAALHAPTFDFPDELIPKGAEIFTELFKLHTLS